VQPESAVQANPSDIVPQSWPGAFKLFNLAQRAFVVNWQTYVLLTIIALVVSLICGMVGGNNTQSASYSLAQLLSTIVSIFFAAALNFVELSSAQAKKVDLSTSISTAGGIFLRYVGMYVLVTFILAVSILLLIFPVFFVVPRLALAPYFLIDKKMGPIEAIKASWHQSKGNVGKVYGIVGVFILLVLTGIAVITIPLTIYLLFAYSPAFAILYMWVQRSAGKTAVAPVKE